MTSIRTILAGFSVLIAAIFAQTALSQMAGSSLVGSQDEKLQRAAPQSVTVQQTAQPAVTEPVDVGRPTPEIGIIHFRGGQLEQNVDQPGHWFEKKKDGTVNYEFFETGSTPQSLIMSGPDGKVMLSVDLGANEIQGKWPGQSRFKTIYTITDITPLSVAPPPVIPPVAPQPPVNSGAPLPRDLQFVEYKSGRFIRSSANDWEQTTSLGDVYRLRQVGYDQNRLYLQDAQRGLLIVLNPGVMQSRVAIDGGVFQPFEALTSVSDIAQTPVPPPTDGRLSEADRNTCLKTGGIVERAGLLGAERCTRPYSDAGQVCSDSAQCEGQCRTTSDVPFGSPVTGICQPSDNPFGCFAEVNNGVAGPGLCVD